MSVNTNIFENPVAPGKKKACNKNFTLYYTIPTFMNMKERPFENIVEKRKCW